MAKSDSSNTFGDFSKKIKLSPDRMNLKPVSQSLSFDECLSKALREGYQLLEEEAKNPPKDSVKPAPNPNSVKLENKLGETSKNAYVRARSEVLNKMSPAARAVIEKMERGDLTKDTRWDTFCKAATILGDSLSK